MRQLKHILFFSALLCSVTGCAQQHKAVKSAYAFYRIVIPGNIQVEEGIAVKRNDTTRFIYLEVAKKTKPSIDTIIYKGRLFSTAVLDTMNKLPLQSGTKLLAAKGYTFWQIQVMDEYPRGKSGGSPKTTILIKGHIGNTRFSIPVKKEKELPALFAE
jgi:hypothetical protein